MIDEHKERLAEEGQHLRGKIKELSDQLSEAEQTLHYYANPNNYTVRGANAACFQNVLAGDNTESDNVRKVYVGGDRARKYFAKYYP